MDDAVMNGVAHDDADDVIQTEGAPKTAFRFDIDTDTGPTTKGAESMTSPGDHELNNILLSVLKDKDVGDELYTKPKQRKITKKRLSEGPSSLHITVPSNSSFIVGDDHETKVDDKHLPKQISYTSEQSRNSNRPSLSVQQLLDPNDTPQSKP